MHHLQLYHYKEPALTDHLVPLKVFFFDKPNQFPISYDQFRDFFFNVTNTPNFLHTTIIHLFTDMLKCYILIYKTDALNLLSNPTLKLINFNVVTSNQFSSCYNGI